MKHKLLIMSILAAASLGASGGALAHDVDYDRGGRREVCRDYSANIRIGGKLEIGVGQACRRDGGAWEIVKLDGPDYARAHVRKRIYDDLRFYDGLRVVIVDRSYRPPVHRYRPYAPVYYDGHEHHHDKHDRHGKAHRGKGHHGKGHGYGHGHGKHRD